MLFRSAYQNGGVGIGLYGNFQGGGGLGGYALDSIALGNGASGFYALGGGVAPLFVIGRSATYGSGNFGVRSGTLSEIHIFQSVVYDDWLQDPGGFGGAVVSYGDNYTFQQAAPGGTLSKR